MKHLFALLFALPLMVNAQVSEVLNVAKQNNGTNPNILISSQQFNGNTNSNKSTIQCGSSLLFNESNAMKRAAFDEQLYNNHINLANNKTSSVTDSTIYNLPLAIHIVHQNGPENINDVAVYDAVDLLNKAFRKKLPYDTAKGADIHIQFCVPWGAITRHVSPLTNMYVDNNVDDAALKQLGLMDNTRYLNIWIVKSITSVYQGPGVAGYATLPYSHGTSEDGIVIEADWINNDPDAVKVLIHEVGHYLGLYHTFEGGCNNTNCMLQGDRVCDTPPDNSTAANCTGTVNSCHTDEDDASSQNPFRSVSLGGLGDQPDMVQNFMDYGNQSCFNRFTKGQRERMRAGLLQTRQSLIQSTPVLCTNCSNTSVVSLNIPDSLLAGVTHTLTVNVSDTTGIIYYWIFDSQVFFTKTINYTAQASGVVPFMLIVYNPTLGCSSQIRDTIVFYCPAVAPVISASPSGAYSLGETVVFSTPDNGHNYTWFVDGVNVGTGTQYSYTLTNNFGHLLTLSANNGTCAATSLSYYINPNNCNNSKENNTWHFGNGAGINFNTNPPKSIPGSFTNYGDHQDFEGCAVLCDANGAALYASNGTQVWNAQTGANLANGGDSLKGSWHSTQSALFVPKYNSNLVYLFTVEDEAGMYSAQGGIYYSIIDKSTNSLTVKNQLLTSPVSEKVTAVKNAMGNGIWVIAQKFNTNQFYAWLVNGSGIGAPVISAVGSMHAPSNTHDPSSVPIGQMCASPSGKKLAVANSGLSFVEVFDFNNFNGVVSNAVKLNVATPQEPYGVAFSPNERYVYACNGSLGQSNWKTYRWNIQAGGAAAINSSYELLGSENNSARGSMQLAPDGKIYCGFGSLGYKFLGVISNPNASSAANCGFQKDGFKLLYGSTLFGLPNPVQSLVANTNPNIIGTDKVCLSGSPQNQQYFFYPTGNATYTWTHKGTNTSTILNDSTLSITFNQAGVDTLILKRHASCGDSYDTLYVNSGNAPAPLNIGNDTTLCAGAILSLNAGAGMYDYVWSNNARTQTASYTTTGKVWVKVITEVGCVLSDTLIISRHQLSSLNLGADTSLCGTQTLTLTAPANVDSYLWNTGATTQTIVADSGSYIVSVTKYGCTFKDTINVLKGVIQNVLPNDTVHQTCNSMQTLISLPSGYSSYLWETPIGDVFTTNSVTLIQTGWYYVTYSNSCGSAKDSVYYKIRRYWSADTIITCDDTVKLITNKSINAILWKKFGTSTFINVLAGSVYNRNADTIKIFGSGIYNFIGTSDTVSYCGVAQQIVVMVDTALVKPNMSVNLGNDIANCYGGITVLDAGSGFERYRWNTGWQQQSLTAYGFGQYWVKAHYCGYDFTDTINISNASFANILGDSLLCENETIILTALPAGGNYLWDSLGVYVSTSSNTLMVTHPGNYRVINQVCDSTAWSTTFLVKTETCITGYAQSVNGDYTLQIFPNPSAGIFNFSHYVDAQVTNSLGQIITDGKNINVINLSDQAAGMYFVNFLNENGQIIYRTKIVKE